MYELYCFCYCFDYFVTVYSTEKLPYNVRSKTHTEKRWRKLFLKKMRTWHGVRQSGSFINRDRIPPAKPGLKCGLKNRKSCYLKAKKTAVSDLIFNYRASHTLQRCGTNKSRKIGLFHLICAWTLGNFHSFFEVL